jgi:hypothetical protein
MGHGRDRRLGSWSPAASDNHRSGRWTAPCERGERAPSFARTDRDGELDEVEAIVARVDPKRFDPSMKVDLAGDFIAALEENQQVKTDLGQVGVAGVAMIRGFGVAAAAGEIACVLTAVLVPPAWLVFAGRLRVGAPAPSRQPPPAPYRSSLR